MMSQDEIRDLAIHLVDSLLDNEAHLLHEYVHEVDGQYTEYTWELQDVLVDFLTEKLGKK